MTSLRDLQHCLALKMEEVKQRDSLIHSLEREIQYRDREIAELQAELDKFKQILKPMTQQLAQNISIQALVLDEEGQGQKAKPGRDGQQPAGSGFGLSSLGKLGNKPKTQVDNVASRIKRIAISAEPTAKLSVDPNDMVLEHYEKNDV